MKKQHILIAAGVSAVIAITYFGFDKTYAKVISCSVSSKSWVTAEYSETVAGISFDSKGNPTTSVDTDYWSEYASEVFKVVTYNGEVTAVYGDFEPIMTDSEYYIAPIPSYDKSMAWEPSFDNFEQNRTSVLTVKTHLTIEDEENLFTEAASKNKHCLSKLDNYIQVKTWYTITYGSDF